MISGDRQNVRHHFSMVVTESFSLTISTMWWTFFRHVRTEGGIIIEKMERQFELPDKPGGIPGFLYRNHAYQLLNHGLDIESDGVTYHLSSQFVGESEMGAVLDLIELERNRRNSA